MDKLKKIRLLALFVVLAVAFSITACKNGSTSGLNPTSEDNTSGDSSVTPNNPGDNISEGGTSNPSEPTEIIETAPIRESGDIDDVKGFIGLPSVYKEELGAYIHTDEFGEKWTILNVKLIGYSAGLTEKTDWEVFKEKYSTNKYEGKKEFHFKNIPKQKTAEDIADYMFSKGFNITEFDNEAGTITVVFSNGSHIYKGLYHPLDNKTNIDFTYFRGEYHYYSRYDNEHLKYFYLKTLKDNYKDVILPKLRSSKRSIQNYEDLFRDNIKLEEEVYFSPDFDPNKVLDKKHYKFKMNIVKRPVYGNDTDNLEDNYMYAFTPTIIYRKGTYFQDENGNWKKKITTKEKEVVAPYGLKEWRGIYFGDFTEQYLENEIVPKWRYYLDLEGKTDAELEAWFDRVVKGDTSDWPLNPPKRYRSECPGLRGSAWYYSALNEFLINGEETFEYEDWDGTITTHHHSIYSSYFKKNWGHCKQEEGWALNILDKHLYIRPGRWGESWARGFVTKNGGALKYIEFKGYGSNKSFYIVIKGNEADIPK